MPTAIRGAIAPARNAPGRAVLPAAVLGAALATTLLTGIALAGPASAMEDPRRPAVEVTHGPSCGPGAVRVQVVNGSEPEHVALVFDGTQVQQEADLAAGAGTELGSGDVDWGVTVDVSVTVTGTDGVALEPVELGTYTRPSKADCDAVGTPTTDVVPPVEPTAPADTPAVPPATTPATTSSTAPGAPTGTVPSPSSSTSSSTSSPTSSPSSPATSSAPRSSAPSAGTASSAPPPATGAAGSPGSVVAPGGVVRVRATGFTPGEQVTVIFSRHTRLLTTVAAGQDGSVETVVQIPQGADLGPAAVELVGAASAASAGVPLEVTARTRPVGSAGTSAPPVTAMAGVALLVAAGGLGVSATRRPRGTRRHDLGR